MLLSWFAFVDVGFGHHDGHGALFPWIIVGDLKIEWALRIDTLTAVMLVVVTTISAFVHLYSIGYMEEDPYRPRFFSYLSLFTFAMLMLVTADNLVQLFFGWEGVGLMSYLLIGFWYHKPEANAAAIKAFIVNRDRRFRLRARHLRRVHDDRRDRLRHRVRAGAVAHRQDHPFPGLGRRCADADLPAPVHGRHGQVGAVPAAHLAAGRHGGADAGLRPHPCRHHGDGGRVHGGAALAAVRAGAARADLRHLHRRDDGVLRRDRSRLVQNDIKRIVAYSTCSQLGYMFVAMGTGAYSVGMFHLFTHAFFKALLFLGSGSVIIAMHHEQDIRHMGGLKDKIPFTYWTMVIGTLALTGFPLTAGYFSKDAIIEAAYVGTERRWRSMPIVLTVIAAALTAFYSWRLIFVTFHGSPHDHHHYEQARESPLVMLIPLGFLAAGSIFAGFPFPRSVRRSRGRRVLPRVRSSSAPAIISSRTCTTFPS